MMIKRLAIVLGLALIPVFLDSCKQQDEPETRTQRKKNKKKPTPKPKKPKRKPLTREERMAIAKQRLAEAMKTRKKPFDRVAAMDSVIQKNYEIKIRDLFAPDALDKVKTGGDLRYMFMDLKSAEEVRTVLENEAAKEIEPNWSPARLEKVKKTSEEKFKHYKIEQVIEARVKTAGGGERTVRGRLEAVTSKAIFVGGQRIPVADLAAPPYWSFDANAVRKKRNNYVYNGFTRPKAEDKETVKEKIGPIVYKKHGCIQRKGKWMSIKRLLVKEIEPLVDAMKTAHDNSEIKRFQEEIRESMLEEGLLDD